MVQFINGLAIDSIQKILARGQRLGSKVSMSGLGLKRGELWSLRCLGTSCP